MLPHQEMTDYLSVRKIGWNNLKVYLPGLDECIYRYAIFSGLQDLPESMYAGTINIIKYSAKMTKTELSVNHIAAVLMQWAMELRSDKGKDSESEHTLQAKTPDTFQHSTKGNKNV